MHKMIVGGKRKTPVRAAVSSLLGGDRSSLGEEVCAWWPPEMPGLLCGLYGCPARLQEELKLGIHFLQEAFAIENEVLRCYLFFFTRRSISVSLCTLFFCQEHLNKILQLESL